MTKSRLTALKPRWSLTNQQPRRLGQHSSPQPCHWPECSARATSKTAGQTYCGAHLFQTLHEQWKG
jgi:hypothetical protein